MKFNKIIESFTFTRIVIKKVFIRETFNKDDHQIIVITKQTYIHRLETSQQFILVFFLNVAVQGGDRI